MVESRLERMIENRDRLNARINLARQRAEKMQRKIQSKRIYLAGEYFIRLMDGDLNRVGKELQDAGLLEEKDKCLFFDGKPAH